MGSGVHFIVSFDFLAYALRQMWGFPEDAQVTAVGVDPFRQQLEVYVEHSASEFQISTVDEPFSEPFVSGKAG